MKDKLHQLKDSFKEVDQDDLRTYTRVMRRSLEDPKTKDGLSKEEIFAQAYQMFEDEEDIEENKNSPALD